MSAKLLLRAKFVIITPITVLPIIYLLEWVHWLCCISCQETDAHLGAASRSEWTGECPPYAALLSVALMRTPQSTSLCSVANPASFDRHAGLMNFSERFWCVLVQSAWFDVANTYYRKVTVCTLVQQSVVWAIRWQDSVHFAPPPNTVLHFGEKCILNSFIRWCF